MSNGEMQDLAHRVAREVLTLGEHLDRDDLHEALETCRRLTQATRTTAAALWRERERREVS